jgi:hypothetical protein
MVDPPGGWAYGFPAPLQGNYEKQLRDAGYPEADIPLALEHSWYHTQPEDQQPADVVCFGFASTDDRRIVEANPQLGESWIKERFIGTASDGDDGA